MGEQNTVSRVQWLVVRDVSQVDAPSVRDLGKLPRQGWHFGCCRLEHS